MRRVADPQKYWNWWILRLAPLFLLAGNTQNYREHQAAVVVIRGHRWTTVPAFPASEMRTREPPHRGKGAQRLGRDPRIVGVALFSCCSLVKKVSVVID